MLFRRGRWHCAKVPRFRIGDRHFAQERQVSWMADYTNADLVDIHLAYGTENCSGTASRRLNTERYPTRCISSHNFFLGMHQRLAETDFFQKAGREWVRIRTLGIE